MLYESWIDIKDQTYRDQKAHIVLDLVLLFPVLD